MEHTADNKGLLSQAFLKATMFGIGALTGMVLLDPLSEALMFPIFHGSENATADAFMAFVQTNLSWIPDIIGLTGDGGILHTDFAQEILAPYYELVETPSTTQLNDTFGSISFDDL